MALSGNLGFVPLDEVLRLLMRSDQRGAVEVRGEGVRGRVFIAKRGITLATTSEDRDLHRHLVNSGYVDDDFLRGVVTGQSSFADLGDREPSMVELLREITIESVYQLKAKGSSFDVSEDVTTPYASPRPFELESILDEALRRAEEWAEVNRVITELGRSVKINRFPADGEEIRIDRDAWRVLSELGAGASVRQVAERLGTTEFWAARVIADMLDQQLVILDDGAPVVEEHALEVEEPRADESWWTEPEDEEDEAPQSAVEDEGEEEEPPAAEPEGRFLGHYIAARPDIAPQAEAARSEQAQADEGAGSLDIGVEEDTEAFLEKVFSQLDAEPEDEGHGLLRRRRMGSTLKEED